VKVEIRPEPSDSERDAILAALDEEASSQLPGPWIEPLGDDQEP
jgi:hypothetical protein